MIDLHLVTRTFLQVLLGSSAISPSDHLIVSCQIYWLILLYSSSFSNCMGSVYCSFLGLNFHVASPSSAYHSDGVASLMHWHRIGSHIQSSTSLLSCHCCIILCLYMMTTCPIQYFRGLLQPFIYPHCLNFFLDVVSFYHSGCQV